ncbi:MAG: hypothetical protein JSV03_06340 [Planctomycetota bacterium]|nr:MAG: hypothetical protein JSV03_06340 [Planctomycetota bacterium]
MKAILQPTKPALGSFRPVLEGGMENRPSSRRLCWLVAGLATIGLLGGCGNGKSSGMKPLKARELPYLDDVAVPQGFKLVDKMTEDYESGGQRMARHEYRGFADTHRVRQFYKEQMPLLGWNLVSDQNVKGVITQRFENKYETCSVQIKPSGMFNRTTIRVIVNPFNRTPTEPPKRTKP